MSLDVRVRRATGADHEAILALERATMGSEAWSPVVLAEELAGPGRVVLVTERDGAVAGWAITRLLGDVADLLRVGVDPGHRRRGLAAALIAASCEEAATAGAERVLLEVSAGNAAARAAYRSSGFTAIHRRPRYYRDGSDAVVLAVESAASRRALAPDP